MTTRQFMRVFKLNANIFLESAKKAEFLNQLHRLMDFEANEVLEALKIVIARDGDDYPRLWYVKCVYDVLLEQKKKMYAKAPVAHSVKEAMKSLFA